MINNFNSKSNEEKASDYNKKANEYYMNEQYNDAIELYDKAINLYPNEKAYYTNKGNALNKIGKYEEALKCFQEALKLDSEYSYAKPGMKEALEKIGPIKKLFFALNSERKEEKKYDYYTYGLNSERKEQERKEQERKEQERKEQERKEQERKEQERKEQETEKNLSKIYGLIKEGNKVISDEVDRSLLIIGKTGAGKSTLANVFGLKKLTSVKEKGRLKILTKEETGIEIGSTHESKTKIPNKLVLDDGLTIWDCPGFGDTDIDQEIANAFYIQRVFAVSKNLKFVLAIRDSDIDPTAKDSFIRVLEQFVNMFKEVNFLQGSISLVVTGSPPGIEKDDIRDSIEEMCKTLESKLVNNNKITQVIKYLKEAIYIFPAPIEEGELKKLNLINDINKSNYTKSTNVNIVISKNSQQVADELFDSSNKMINNLLTEIAKKIEKQCDKVNNKSNEIIYTQTYIERAGNSVKQFFTGKTTIKHYKELLNLNSILVFENFCNLVLNPQQNIQEWLISLDRDISSTALILTQDNSCDKAGINELERQIKEKCKYVQFLSKVCESKKIDTSAFTEIFQSCKAAIDKASLKGTESLILSENENNIKYYEQAIKFLDKYPDNKKCIVIKAEAFYHLARIENQLGNFEKSIINCIKSISLHDQNTSYELIDSICIKNSQMLKNIVGNKNILDYLFKKNDLALNQQLSGMIDGFLGKKTDNKTTALIEHIDGLYSIYQSLSNVVNNKVSNDIDNFKVQLIGIMQIIMSKSSQIELYISYISEIHNVSGKSYSISIDKWMNNFDIKKIQSTLLDQIKSLELENCDLDYYKKVISYTDLYQDDKICVKIAANACLKLAERVNAKEDKIEYYKKAITLNDKLFALCKSTQQIVENGKYTKPAQDNKFYADNSIKRKACESLGDFYFQLGQFEEALKQFEVVDLHSKVKKCFKELINANNHNKHYYMEQKGDYFSKKAMIDSSIDSYNDALSYTDKPDDHARINKKMSSALSSISNKTNEFTNRASDVENTKIVYLMNQVEYDNPLLNHPEILKELSIKLGRTESEVINIFSSFDKEFLEESCITGNVDILYDSV